MGHANNDLRELLDCLEGDAIRSAAENNEPELIDPLDERQLVLYVSEWVRRDIDCAIEKSTASTRRAIKNCVSSLVQAHSLSQFDQRATEGVCREYILPCALHYIGVV